MNFFFSSSYINMTFIKVLKIFHFFFFLIYITFFFQTKRKEFIKNKVLENKKTKNKAFLYTTLHTHRHTDYTQINTKHKTHRQNIIKFSISENKKWRKVK